MSASRSTRTHSEKTGDWSHVTSEMAIVGNWCIEDDYPPLSDAPREFKYQDGTALVASGLFTEEEKVHPIAFRYSEPSTNDENLSSAPHEHVEADLQAMYPHISQSYLNRLDVSGHFRRNDDRRHDEAVEDYWASQGKTLKQVMGSAEQTSKRFGHPERMMLDEEEQNLHPSTCANQKNNIKTITLGPKPDCYVALPDEDTNVISVQAEFSVLDYELRVGDGTQGLTKVRGGVPGGNFFDLSEHGRAALQALEEYQDNWDKEDIPSVGDFFDSSERGSAVLQNLKNYQDRWDKEYTPARRMLEVPWEDRPQFCPRDL